MNDYIPDLTQRYPEGFGMPDKTLDLIDDEPIPYEGKWYSVSYYTWGGSQEYTEVYVPDGADVGKTIHEYLVATIGKDYGEINDYECMNDWMED